MGVTLNIIDNLSKETEKHLDTIFKKNGQFIPVSGEYLFNNFTQLDISAYCHKNALYGIVTHELLEFIKPHIIENETIEIGSGAGILGTALNIIMYDNFVQSWPDIRMFYDLMGQPVINYHRNTFKGDANTAILTLKPRVVVASWVTHRYNEYFPALGGNVHGVDEVAMFNDIEKYIFFGNDKTHKDKPLFRDGAFNIERIKNPNFFSRSLDHDLNTLFIITKK